MQSILRLALCLALAVALFSSAASAAFLYTELTSTDTQQCAQASVVFVHMYECGFCFSTGASSSYTWLCNMTNAEKFEWASSSTCTGQPDSSTSKNLYVCESGILPSVYDGTSDAIMNGILNLAFAPGKLFTVASYFHSSESTVCANGQNAPEIVATSATFCSATSTVTLCNSTHVEELTCASGCGAASCTTTSSTPLPCATSTSGTVKLECRIDVLSPPQGVQPPLGGGGNPFPDFPPGFNPPPFDGTFPPGFNPPPFDGTFPPGFNPPPFDGTFPPGFNPPPFDGSAFPPTASAPTPQTAPAAAVVAVRMKLVIVANLTTLPVFNTCTTIRSVMSSVLGVDSGLTTCNAVALNKRAGTSVEVDITFSGSAATVANAALLGADKNATITALSARLLQIPGVESVSSVQAEQVNPPTASSAPVKPAAPSNSKASPASSFSFSSIVILSLVSLALAVAW